MILTIPYQRLALTENQFILLIFGLLPFAQILFSAFLGLLLLEGPTSGWHRYGSFLFSIKLALFQVPFMLALGYFFTPRLKRNTLKTWEACEVGVWTVLIASLAATFLWWIVAILFSSTASFTLLLNPQQWFQLPFFTLFYYLNGGLSLALGGYVSWYLARHNPYAS